MLTILPKNISTPKLHQYLLSAVAPRPIAFASTLDEKGNPNLSPFSFFNVFSANPPILIFSPARRVRDNSTKHTLENILKTKEVVINVVNYNLVQQTSLASVEYPEGTNEFIKAGLTMLKSELVKPFRVAESPIQFECKVNEVVPLGKEGGAGNLVIAEIVCMHIHESVLNEHDEIDQNALDLVARAGANEYCRAKNGFFTVPKPVSHMGIGIDHLPKEIRSSKWLTGNDLGKLGNTENLPKKSDVDKFLKENPQFLRIKTKEKHIFAKEFLEKNDIESALKVLLINEK
ncbi:flavin reductase family protein [Namhaeicola litoreus]|uniref:Flavin reductase family protein n=1 Tax=Namhaeicola litoreus TaxID=1052145 RepID=A0ABW3XYK4_9FLAO